MSDTLLLLVDSEDAVVRDHCVTLASKKREWNRKLRAEGSTCRWVLFNPCKFDLASFDKEEDEAEKAEKEEANDTQAGA